MVALDPLDARLLTVLAEVGRAAVHEIAARLGVDAREVAARLVALSASGLPLVVGVECDQNRIRAALANAGGWGGGGYSPYGTPNGPYPATPPVGPYPPQTGPVSGPFPAQGTPSGPYPVQGGTPSGPYPAQAMPGGHYPQGTPSGPYPVQGTPSGPYPAQAMPGGHHPVQGTPSGPYPGQNPQAGAYHPQTGSPSGPFPAPHHYAGTPNNPFAAGPQPTPPATRGVDPMNTWGPPQSSSWARGDQQTQAVAAGPFGTGPRTGTVGTTLETEGLEGERLAISLVEVVDPADFLFTAAGYQLQEGERAVVVHTELANRGTIPFSALPDMYLVLVAADGQTISKAPVALSSRPQHRIGVQPGETVGGHTVYVLPEPTPVTAVRWSPRPDDDKHALTWTVDD